MVANDAPVTAAKKLFGRAKDGADLETDDFGLATSTFFGVPSFCFNFFPLAGSWTEEDEEDEELSDGITGFFKPAPPQAILAG